MTYKEIVDLIKDTCNDNYFINDFSYGNISDINTPDDQEPVNYPYAFLNPVSISQTEQFATLNANLIIMTQTYETLEEELIGQSNCVNYLNQIIGRLKMNLDNPLVDFNFPVTVTPFKERFSDNVVGATANLSITFPYGFDDCDTPFDRFPIGFTLTGVTGDDAFVNGTYQLTDEVVWSTNPISQLKCIDKPTAVPYIKTGTEDDGGNVIWAKNEVSDLIFVAQGNTDPIVYSGCGTTYTDLDIGILIPFSNQQILSEHDGRYYPNEGTFELLGDTITISHLDIIPTPLCPTPTPSPAVDTPTPTPTTSVTTTPSVTPTSSITPTPSITSTPSITPTSSVTQTPSITPTSSVTQTPSVTSTPSVTQTPSITATPSVTQTPSITPTTSVTQTPSITPTSSITATPSITPTSSVTATPSITATPSQTPSITVTPSITATPSVTPSTSAIPFDTDAASFLADVIASGGTVDATISGATDTFYKGLKSNNLWNKMIIFYPLIGGNAAGQSVQGIRSSGTTYDLTFVGGMTHSVSGITGNNTNASANTNFSAINLPDARAMGCYINESSSLEQSYEMGGGNGFRNVVILSYGSTGSGYFGFGGLSTYNPTTVGDRYVGNLMASIDSSNQYLGYKNGSVVLPLTTNSDSVSNHYLSLLGDNRATVPSYTAFGNSHSPCRMAFAFYSEYLNGTEMGTLTTLISNYQTSLGRNF